MMLDMIFIRGSLKLRISTVISIKTKSISPVKILPETNDENSKISAFKLAFLLSKTKILFVKYANKTERNHEITVEKVIPMEKTFLKTK